MRGRMKVVMVGDSTADRIGITQHIHTPSPRPPHWFCAGSLGQDDWAWGFS